MSLRYEFEKFKVLGFFLTKYFVSVFLNLCCHLPLSVDKEEHKDMPNAVVRNRFLIYDFLDTAHRLLAPGGEIHIASKEVPPYTFWFRYYI